MQVCNHEEAHTRIFVHVRDAVEHGAQKVLIRTVGTDVVVIAIAEYSNLCLIRPDVSVDRLWHGKTFPVHINQHHLRSLEA